MCGGGSALYMLLYTTSLFELKRVKHFSLVSSSVTVGLMFELKRLKHFSLVSSGFSVGLMFELKRLKHFSTFAFGCCFVSANGLLVDVCQCCCLLMLVCLPLSRHFPCCKTW